MKESIATHLSWLGFSLMGFRDFQRWVLLFWLADGNGGRLYYVVSVKREGATKFWTFDWMKMKKHHIITSIKNLDIPGYTFECSAEMGYLVNLLLLLCSHCFSLASLLEMLKFSWGLRYNERPHGQSKVIFVTSYLFWSQQYHWANLHVVTLYNKFLNYCSKKKILNYLHDILCIIWIMEESPKSINLELLCIDLLIFFSWIIIMIF